MKMARRKAGGDIDWQQVHARLARASAGTREALAPSAERVDAVLEDRARRLARPLAAAQPSGGLLDLLAFRLAGERYAVETRYVQEVVRLSLTPIPGVPGAVAGVGNLRGEVLVVFDLRPLLGLTRHDATNAP